MKHAALIFGLLTGIAAGTAEAQISSTTSSSEGADRSSRSVSNATVRAQANQVRAPGPELQTGLAGFGVNFTAAGDDKVVSLQGTRSWQDPSRRILATNNLSGKIFGNVTDDEDQSGYFVTDFGRVRGTGFELSFARNWSPHEPLPSTGSERDAALVTARARCHTLVGTDPEITTAFCNDQLTTLGDILPLLGEDDQTDVLTDAWLQSTVHTAGLTLGAAGKQFKFRDPVTLASDKTEEISWTASLHYGQSREISHFGRYYFGGGVAYTSTFSDADTRTLCSPPPATGPQECFTAPFAKPEEDEGTTAFLVARNQQHREVFGLPYVLQFKPAYSFDTEAFGIETSLYVFPGKGGLRGGIRLSLQTDDNDAATDDENAQIGIFVGSAF